MWTIFSVIDLFATFDGDAEFDSNGEDVTGGCGGGISNQSKL